jgi:hypothetical protein
MLSNLIWGSPVKAVQEATENEQEEDDDDQADNEERQLHEEAQVISDDDDEEDIEAQTASANPYDNAAARRFSAAEKGKGRPAAPPSNSKPIPRVRSESRSEDNQQLIYNCPSSMLQSRNPHSAMDSAHRHLATYDQSSEMLGWTSIIYLQVHPMVACHMMMKRKITTVNLPHHQQMSILSLPTSSLLKALLVSQ